MKRYDRAYFDRWYRGADPFLPPDALERNVALAVAVAESVLDRPIESVLDVGCGEGRWQPVLATLRPGATYLGFDPSEYAIERFGADRNLRRAGFADLPGLDLPEPFDLVVCADVLHYVPDADLEAGLATLTDLVGGAALLETFTSDDPVGGDHHGFHARPAAWYRRAFREAGLVAVGLQMYVHQDVADELDAMDLPA